MTDHQFRQLLEALNGINTNLSSIAKTLSSYEEADSAIDLNEAIERGRLFGRD